MLVAGRGHVGRGRDLGHADPEHAAGSARRAGTDPDEDAGDAGFHELQGRVVLHAVADDDWNFAHANKVLERELVVRARRVPRRQHGALDDVDVSARLLDDLGALLGACRHGRNGARNSRRLDRFDSFADQPRLDRLAVCLFEDCVERRLVRVGDLLDHRRGILVAAMHAIEVEHGDSAELAHRDCEVDVDHAIHRRTPEGKRKREAIAHRKRDVDLVGIERHATGHKCDLIEAIRPARAPPDPDLEARLLPGNRFSGLDPALVQGVFTPLNGAGSLNYRRPLSLGRCIARSST